MSAFESVLWSDIADGTVESHGVVVEDVIIDDSSGIFERERGKDADTFALEGFVPTFNFSIGLRIVWRGFDMSHAGDSNELFEVFCDELRSVVGDDSRSDTWVALTGVLDDGGDVFFLHFLANFVVNDESATAIEYGTEEVESASNVEVTDIDMPVFVGI